MTSNEMTHTPESGAAMPAGLAAILTEPGWRSNNWIWYFDVDQSLDGNPGIYVSVDRHVPFTCSLTIDDVFGPVALRADQVAHVLALMRRIEAALDADRAGQEEGLSIRLDDVETQLDHIDSHFRAPEPTETGTKGVAG